MAPQELKLERIRQGVPQYRLAAAIGVPQTTLCAWENGRRPLSPDQERIVRDALRDLVLGTQRQNREPASVQ